MSQPNNSAPRRRAGDQPPPDVAAPELPALSEPPPQGHYPPPGGWSIGDDLATPPVPRRSGEPSARTLWALGIVVLVIVVIATVLTLADGGSPRASAGSTPTTIGAGDSSGASDLCRDQTDAEWVATTYLAAALTGAVTADQSCVYRHSVSPSATRRLRGQLFVPDGDPSPSGPSLSYHFKNVSGAKSAGVAATVTVTVTREADGRFWVTHLDIH
jgi:hypothetical protein